MGPARSPVAASKHRVRSELQSPGKLLRNLREFHSRRDTDERSGLRVDTCFKRPLYYGNEILGSSFQCDFAGYFCSREGCPGRTQSRREGYAATDGIGPEL